MFSAEYMNMGTSILAGISALLGAAFLVEFLRCRKMKGFLKDSIDALHDGKILFDERENFVLANEKAKILLPFLKEAATTPRKLSGFLDYMYDNALEGDDDSITNMLGRAARKSERVGFREIILSGDSRLCLVEVLKTKCGRTVLVVSDVSEMKNQEEHVLRLHQYNNELFQAVEAATNGLMISRMNGPEHQLVFMNTAFCQIFNHNRQDLQGANVIDLFSAIDDAEIQETIRNIMGRKVSGEVQFRIVDGGGHVRWYALRLTPVPASSGMQDLYIGVFGDMTELKLREAEFFKAQKLEALGQLAAGVAHDFNNVLSIIDGYARLAGNGLADGDQTGDYIQRIRVASARGADLIKQMLTFSRHKIIDDTVIDLGKVLREQETLLGPLLDATIRMTMMIYDENIYVECPADNIVQIMMNLSVNARDAMPQGGSLIIELRKVDERSVTKMVREKMEGRSFICLSVSDTGTGMKKDVVERIFDPFYTTKEQGKGTGLGLSMVYGLVKQAGGFIDVKSTPGMGTSMMIYLPLSDKEPNRVIKGNLKDIESMRLEGFTALVAEDEPDLLLLVSGMLERLGMKVIRASNGSEALALQEDYEGEIDILLTDVVMPEMNGVDLSELLISLRPKTKVIFMSGYPAAGQMARVQLPEGACFLAKPVHYETLARMIYNRLNENGTDGAEKFEAARWQSDEISISGGGAQ